MTASKPLPAGDPGWRLTGQTIEGWFKEAAGTQRRRWQIPSRSTCAQIAEAIQFCTEPYPDAIREQLDQEERAAEAEARIIGRWVKIAKELATKTDWLLAKYSNDPTIPKPGELGDGLIVGLDRLQAEIRHLLRLFESGGHSSPPHDAAVEVAKIIREEWQREGVRVPLSKNPDDCLCVVVTLAVNWIAERCGGDRITREGTSGALRGTRGSGFHKRKAQSGAKKSP